MEPNATPALEAVLKKTRDSSYLKEEIKGYDWKDGIDYNKILESYGKSGFQATNFGLAVEEINKMLTIRDTPLKTDFYNDPEDPFTTIKTNCTIFLGYTSNIISSGLRETIKFLVQNNLVNVYYNM